MFVCLSIRLSVSVLDVYVKASLFVAAKKLKKKKTTSCTPRPGLTNVLWNEALCHGNEALTFTSLSRQQLAAPGAGLELTLHHGNHGDAVAKVTLGSDNDAVGAEEMKHWTDMLNGRPAVAKWHELRPLTTANTSHDHHHHHHQQQQQQQDN